MKTEIEIPEGYEIDVLTFKKVEKKLPMSWSEVNSCSKKCEKELVALEKLLILRDIYNNNWVADWKDDNKKYVIEVYSDILHKNNYYSWQRVMNFKTEELRDLFFETFTELLIIAKPLL